MSTKSSILSEITANSRAFALSVAIGAIVTLGVRSLFVGPDHAAHAAAAPGNAAAAVEHDAAGHAGHAHDAPAVPQEREDDTEGADEHRGHGGDSGDTEKPVAEKPVAEKPASETAATGVLLDLGNTACPVMGGEVNGKTFTEWNGLRVGHCCPGCQKRFLAKPEALLDEVSPKWREARKAVVAIDTADGKKREALLAKAAERWPVVRQPKADAPAIGGLLIDLGNANCPVMGGEVNGKTFTEWKGLRVGHCCPGCSKSFLKNPEALLDEVAPKWRDALAAVAKAGAAKAAHREHAIATLAKTWKVVRRPKPAKSE